MSQREVSLSSRLGQHLSQGEQQDLLRRSLEHVLANYATARESGRFGSQHELWSVFEAVQHVFEACPAVRKRPTIKVAWSVGQGNWASVPWIAFLDTRETHSTQGGVYCVLLFRQDMSGVYVTFNQGVTEPRRSLGTARARQALRKKAQELRTQCAELQRHGFALDDQIDLRAGSGLGRDYEYSTIAYKLYQRGAVPPDAEILQDLEAVLSVYDRYLSQKNGPVDRIKPAVIAEKDTKETGPQLDLASAMGSLIDHIDRRGFVFEPWQIAAYVTALRTKPFVILAGVTGTGKSRLPALIAEATGGVTRLLPVRPDWTDSSEVLGYVDLQGRFLPGPLLELAREATGNPDKHFVCIVDEMNLARVEHYFAEVLSCIENRRPANRGGFETGPLLSLSLSEADASWAKQGLPANLAIVGTVNMDESAHGFSRKVLDRAFTLEFSDIDLAVWKSGSSPLSSSTPWDVSAWYPRAVQLSGLTGLDDEETEAVEAVIETLADVNALLTHAQLQVGYRTRDEVALFVLNAKPISRFFTTRTGEAVDPLDLALQMKVLPRIAGGSNAVRRVVLGLLGWALDGRAVEAEEAEGIVAKWDSDGRPTAVQKARYPRTAARLCLMWDRLTNEGFTSFWL